jgi:hypothetical protein
MVPPVDSSEIDHHGVHLISVDLRGIPCHTVTSGAKVATDHPIHHAADELSPGGLIVATIRYTRLGGVVEKLIVADPQGGSGGIGGQLANWSKGLGEHPACLPSCRCLDMVACSDGESYQPRGNIQTDEVKNQTGNERQL